MNRMQKQGFSFEPAQPEDMEAVFGLIDARIQWMEERGIDQWDRQIYWEVFPRQYYEEARKQHRLFVLRQSHDCAVAGAVVLTDSDPRWEENDNGNQDLAIFTIWSPHPLQRVRAARFSDAVKRLHAGRTAVVCGWTV